MTEERLKEIKESIEFQKNITMIRDYDRTFINEEIELYNEVVRLREIIKEAIKDVEENQIQNEYTDRCGFIVKENKWWLEDSDILLGILKQNNLTLEQLTGIDNE